MPSVALGWFHRYPARFAPVIVHRMVATCVRRAGKSKPTILDPFSGTSATLAVARKMGCNAVGIELSHLGLLISQVRLNPPSDLDGLLDFVNDVSNTTYRAWAYPIEAELVDWIGRNNSLFLSHFLMLLDCIENVSERRWLELAMSAALRPSSVWLPGSIKPQTDPQRSPPDLRRILRLCATKLARDCRAELAENSSLAAGAFVVKGSATHLPLVSESVGAIVTSPPYGTMYDYFDVQRLSYLAFRWPRENEMQIGRSARISHDGVGFIPPKAMMHWYNDSFRAEETIEGRALRAYLRAMEAHFREAFRVVRSGGTAAYAIANTFRENKEFDLVGAMIDLLRRSGFEGIRWSRRAETARRILPAGRDPNTGRFSSKPGRRVEERIIYAKKP
jgi:hypothetical protein